MPEKELENLDPETIRAFFVGETRTRVKPLTGLEWRESGSGDGSRYLSGHAAVFNERTVLYEGSGFRITEAIDPGFFDDVLADKPDCHFNMGHDMNTAMARTGIAGIGGLELACDLMGLRIAARLSSSDPDVLRLASKMDLGIMDQMSFAFSVAKESMTVVTDEDAGVTSYDYTLLKCRALSDVCVCAQGAYSTTEAALRSFLKETSGIGSHIREVARETAEGAAATPVPVKDDGADESRVEHQIAIMTELVTLATSQHPTTKEEPCLTTKKSKS